MAIAALLRETRAAPQPAEAPFHDDSARLLFCGKSLVADPSGALYWPAEGTLIVSDLRLGRGCYLSDPQAALPPFDTVSSLEKLEEAVDRYAPLRVVALGRSFSDLPERAPSAYDIDWLQDLMDDRQWFWISDSDAGRPPEPVGGSVQEAVTLGGLRFRHAPLGASVSHEIAGGAHPVAHFRQHGHPTAARCFVSNGKRLLIPSLGDCSSGNSVVSDGLAGLLGGEGMFVWVVASGRVEALTSGLLLEPGAVR